MARSHRNVKTGDSLTVDGVEMSVISGRAKLQIRSNNKPIMKPARKSKRGLPPRKP